MKPTFNPAFIETPAFADEEFIEKLKTIPNINKYPLHYLFEDMKMPPQDNDLWLEFGVFSGKTINYFARFTNEKVYGFDSFKGLPEDWRPGFGKGTFSREHRRTWKIPKVLKNVELVVGLFNETLEDFLEKHPDQKVGFIHVDSDLYSSAIYTLDKLAPRMKKGTIILFDELVNYDGYAGDNGELRALYEFVKKYNVKFEWIGMNGKIGIRGYNFEQVALKIVSIELKC